jgi:hypothetical protein
MARRPFFKVVKYGGYPLRVLLCHGATIQQIDRKLVSLHFYTGDVKIIDLNYDGLTALLPRGDAVIQLREIPRDPHSWAVLAHEIFHAVDHMMEKIGCELVSGSEEAYAYAIQDLTERILSVLPKRR